jgi:hypothetical protein
VTVDDIENFAVDGDGNLAAVAGSGELALHDQAPFSEGELVEKLKSLHEGSKR